MKPVGILGGTFDPIHHGHLRLALELYEALDLKQVRLIPLATPPHRLAPIAPARLRLAMLEAAIGNEPALLADDRELRRQGRSYTVDTLSDLRRELADIPVCLLLGMDAFAALHTWHRWQQLIGLTHIVVASRSEAYLPVTGAVMDLFERHKTTDLQDLQRMPAGRIVLQPIPVLDISASRIRALIARGRNPRYLLPEPVIALINQHNLYRNLTPHAT
jgi:nicotinate-nucleotide adenylyltransferase